MSWEFHFLPIKKNGFNEAAHLNGFVWNSVPQKNPDISVFFRSKDHYGVYTIIRHTQIAVHLISEPW